MLTNGKADRTSTVADDVVGIPHVRVHGACAISYALQAGEERERERGRKGERDRERKRETREGRERKRDMQRETEGGREKGNKRMIAFKRDYKSVRKDLKHT